MNNPNDLHLIERELTEGEQLVGIKFNPSDDPMVDHAKAICAQLSDIVFRNNDDKGAPSYLYNLIKGKALGEILVAQMLVVKLLTLKY